MKRRLITSPLLVTCYLVNGLLFVYYNYLTILIERYNIAAYYGVLSWSEITKTSPMYASAIGFGQAFPKLSLIKNFMPMLAIASLIATIALTALDYWYARASAGPFRIFLRVALQIMSHAAVSDIIRLA